MNTLSYKTQSVKAEDVKKEWVVVDATDQVLGRLCAKVAKILRGKYKPCFTPHVDCGDNVIIINADKVVLTGNKWNDREYLSYTGYPGGQRVATPAILQKKSLNKHIKPGMHPLFLHVIKGMLPKNKLGAQLLKNVHIYNGSEHPHEAQQPKLIDINNLK
ncbi:MAG: 50S ribosomal protein L13 [Muribaculaceae bacterium]|nr:50S ribosomal protein L13 [Muribaculaceae bacterium]